MPTCLTVTHCLCACGRRESDNGRLSTGGNPASKKKQPAEVLSPAVEIALSRHVEPLSREIRQQVRRASRSACRCGFLFTCLTHCLLLSTPECGNTHSFAQRLQIVQDWLRNERRRFHQRMMAYFSSKEVFEVQRPIEEMRASLLKGTGVMLSLLVVLPPLLSRTHTHAKLSQH